MRTDFSGIRSMLSSALCDGRCVATAAWFTLSRKSASGAITQHRVDLHPLVPGILLERLC